MPDLSSVYKKAYQKQRENRQPSALRGSLKGRLLTTTNHSNVNTSSDERNTADFRAFAQGVNTFVFEKSIDHAGEIKMRYIREGLFVVYFPEAPGRIERGDEGEISTCKIRAESMCTVFTVHHLQNVQDASQCTE